MMHQHPPAPPLPFPPKGPKSIPTTAMSSSLTPTNAQGWGGWRWGWGRGAIQLTFSPHTQRKTNNCQTNKEKRSSFWGTAKTLQYTRGSDVSFYIVLDQREKWDKVRHSNVHGIVLEK